MVGVRGRVTDVVKYGRLGPKGLFGSWQGMANKDRLTHPCYEEHLDGNVRLYVGGTPTSATGSLPTSTRPLEAALRSVLTSVLAAALRGRCAAIVSANLKHFPATCLDRFGPEAISPDDFLLNQLDLAARPVLDCLREQAAATKNPSLEIEELLVNLGRAGAPNFADEALKRVE